MTQGILIALLVFENLLFLWMMREKKPRETQPICGCGHHICYHHDGQSCWHGRASKYETGDCGCQKYIGPEPVPEYIALEEY